MGQDSFLHFISQQFCYFHKVFNNETLHFVSSPASLSISFPETFFFSGPNASAFLPTVFIPSTFFSVWSWALEESFS